MADVINEQTKRKGTSPLDQAYQILHLGFVLLPIIAGLDKFFNVLVEWDLYLAPSVIRMLPVSSSKFMYLVGAVEIAAGIIVAIKPRVGGYIVMAWMWCTIINYFMVPGFYDLALRDFGLSLGALALARFSTELRK